MVARPPGWYTRFAATGGTCLITGAGRIACIIKGFPCWFLWEKPGGVAAPGFHLQHMAGVLDRLFTYAAGHCFLLHNWSIWLMKVLQLKTLRLNNCWQALILKWQLPLPC